MREPVRVAAARATLGVRLAPPTAKRASAPAARRVTLWAVAARRLHLISARKPVRWRHEDPRLGIRAEIFRIVSCQPQEDTRHDTPTDFTPSLAGAIGPIGAVRVAAATGACEADAHRALHVSSRASRVAHFGPHPRKPLFVDTRAVSMMPSSDPHFVTRRTYP